MSINLHLFYFKLAEIDTTKPIEHQLKESKLTVDCNVYPCNVSSGVWEDGTFSNPNGVGDLINLKSSNPSFLICKTLRNLNGRASQIASDRGLVRSNSLLSEVLIEALVLIDKGNHIILRWC